MFELHAPEHKAQSSGLPEVEPGTCHHLGAQKGYMGDSLREGMDVDTLDCSCLEQMPPFHAFILSDLVSSPLSTSGTLMEDGSHG